MNNSFWGNERLRFMLVLFLASLGGMMSGQWLISLTISLFGFILWLLYKLHQLNIWLENGAKSRKLPDSDGLWAHINHKIQGLQKKSNLRKKRMAKLLKRSQDIISGLPYGTIVLNKYNEIDWANKASLDYLNIDHKKDRGQRIDNLLRFPELQPFLSSQNSTKIEITFPPSHGRRLAIQLIHLQQKQKLLIAEDISERIQLQQMRKNFIANASHELKTPLTVIKGYLEILQEDENLPKHLQTAIASATDQSSRMQRIIEDLLNLSRLENSDLNNNASAIIDLPLILKNICSEEATLTTEGTHTLETDIDSHLKLKGIETEIMSVCSNLIHNSIRHTRSGTHVKVEWKKHPWGEARLTVKDNGQGISTEHIPHLTERFYRVDKGRSRDKGGTGLGMAIVLHVVQRHGGRLDIQSTVGKGSIFTACFPAERVVDESTH
ncbi:MAG: phosphate regulon sensor histidine kinase PhoR [Methylococcales bacterium]|nr:phosphate regulon sensor histidine kinase PhoR [Methylococcales bacterium]